MSNAPVRKLNSAAAPGLQIAIWRNEDGNYSFTVQKQFKPKDSKEWKETKNLFPSDMAALSLLSAKAVSVVETLKEQDRAAKQGQGTTKPPPRAESNTDFADDDIPF